MTAQQLAVQVAKRAKGQCEYCHMNQSLQGTEFHVEHINPSSRGGLTVLANLALACPACNMSKSSRIELFDPVSQTWVRVFNPRRDTWADHFSWEEFRIVARTAIGRALIEAFDLNEPRRIRIRQAEQMFGMF